jgi:hypothetical protein
MRPRLHTDASKYITLADDGGIPYAIQVLFSLSMAHMPSRALRSFSLYLFSRTDA